MSSQDNRNAPVGSQSQEVFRTFFEHFADAYLILEGNVFVDCNQAAVRMLRAQSKSEVLSTHPADLSPEFQPDGRPSGEKADEMIRLALEQGSHRFEWVHRRLDGEDFYAEVLLTPMTVGGKTLLHTTWRDITERKQAEAYIEQLVAVIEASPDAIFSTTPKGEIVTWNPAAERIFGYTRAEIIGKPAIILAPPEVQAEAKQVLMGLMRGKPAIALETIRVAKDGRRLDALVNSAVLTDESGNVRGISVTIQDITERKRLEREIQNAFERRGYQVQISTEISQEIAQAVELNDLFHRVVTLTKERLGYYHTQLLRYDPTQKAVVLVAGYGKTGEKMLAAGHRMPLGQGLIGVAAATGETVMRPDLSEDPDWRPNPLLPETRGEIAVPIKLQDEILGVLDIQSSQAGALTEDDQLLLEGICGQIAIAMEQTRLRQEMEARLEEIDRLYRAMRQEGWQAYRDSAALPEAIQYDQAGVHPVSTADLTEALFAKVELALPGGDALGELAIADDPQNPLSEDDKAFLEQASQQIALALENARLFEQTQQALAKTESLYNASREISAAQSAGQLAETLVKHIDRTNLDRVVVALIDETVAEPLTVEVAAIWDKANQLQAGNRFTAAQMPLLEKLKARDVLLVDDFTTDERIDPLSRATFQYLGVRSAALIPINVGSSLFGWLLLETLETPRQFSKEDITPFVALAEQAAVVLESRRLFQRTQEALTVVQERERQLAEAMRIANMADWELDASTLTFMFSDRLLEMLGTTAEELGGYHLPAEQYMQQFVYPDDIPLIANAIQEGLQSETPADFSGHVEYRLVRADGEIRHIVADYRVETDADGQPVRAFGSFLDTTERKQAEEALREAQERAQTILETITVPMVIVRIADNVLTFANQPALEEVQRAHDDVVGKPVTAFYYKPEDRDKFLQALQASGRVANMEMQLLRADGTPFWALLSARVFDYQGEPSILTTFSDITERIQAQEAVTRRAMELSTVAEVGTTISTILDEQQLLDTIVQLTQRRFALYHCHIFTLDERKQTLQVRACGWEENSPHADTLEMVTVSLDQEQSLVAQAARNRHAVIVNDVRSDPNWLPNDLLPDTRSEMAVPIIVGNQVLGVLDVQAKETDRFTDVDISIMSTLASQLAVALQNARTYAQAQQRAEYEALINQISQRIQSTTSVENALQVAIRELGRALGARRANIQLGLLDNPEPNNPRT